MRPLLLLQIILQCVVLSVALIIIVPQSMLQCSTYLLNWSAGIPPYILSIMPGRNTTNEMAIGSDIHTNAYSWYIDMPEGEWSFRVIDSTGASGTSTYFAIYPGTSQCEIMSTSLAFSGDATAPPSSDPLPTTTLNEPSPNTTSDDPSTPFTLVPSHSSSKAATTKIIAITVPIVAALLILGAIAAVLLYRRHKRRTIVPEKDAILEGQDATKNIPTPSSGPMAETERPISAADYYSPAVAPLVTPIPTYAPIIATVSSSSTGSYNDAVSDRANAYSPPPISVFSSSASPPDYAMATSSMFPEVENSDEIGHYADAHREIIPLDLEEKLRRARYAPTDNPNEIPADVWLNQYHVGYFELKRLQELYDRNHEAQSSKQK